MSLSKLINLMLTLSIITSCVEVDSKSKGNSNSLFKNNKSSSSTSQKSIKKSPYNSLNSQRDLVGCLGAVTLSPMVILTEGILNAIARKDKVDLYIDQNTIDLVKRDIDAYLADGNDEITPEDFWDVLSNESKTEITYAMLKSYKKLNRKKYNEKRKLLAHSFLYLFESEKESGTFTFSYHHRDDTRENVEKYSRESYSFAASKKLKDSLDVGICGYFKYHDFDILDDDQDPDILKETRCSDGKNRVVLTLDYNNEYKVNVNGTETALNYEDLKVKEEENKTKIKYNRWFRYPKLELKAYKDYEYQDEVSGLDMELKYSRNDKVALEDMACLSLINN
tara:strand:+ start:244114 stop:245124 length:1011 start_codon:yes stop_codon:yes gene_type:complete